MAINTIGDQARAFVLQSQTARLRSTLQVLSQEMASGKVADQAKRVGGNTTILHHYESQITLLKQYQQTGAEAATVAETMQHVLGALHEDSSSFSNSLIAANATSMKSQIGLRVSEARSMFASAVSRLNTQIADQFIFAGQATDTPPVVAADTILSELTTVTTGLSNAADLETAIASWFDAAPGGGGYLDFAYQGTTGVPRLVQIADQRSVAFMTSGATPSVREVLKAFALAAVADGVAMPDSEQIQAIRRSGQILLDNQQNILDESGRLGLLEQLADRFQAEHSNALALVQIGRSKLVSADPFDTATALSEVQTQMETLYSLTARLSKLKLVDYLR